ncbi:MAG TPA: hypothetical protein VK915_01775 [Gaiellaceae bacterium]|nr:hypothetical protein [Gaiellaceae bacterium]
MRNTKAVWAFLTALLSLGALGGAAAASRYYDEVRLVDAVVAVPVALAFGVAAVVLGRRARAQHLRSLGRSGSRGFVALARFLAAVALILAVTAALALAVFAVLVLVLE